MVGSVEFFCCSPKRNHPVLCMFTRLRFVSISTSGLLGVLHLFSYWLTQNTLSARRQRGNVFRLLFNFQQNMNIQVWTIHTLLNALCLNHQDIPSLRISFRKRMSTFLLTFSEMVDV